MGNEQSGPDGVGVGEVATAASSAPSTPRPILRHSAANLQLQFPLQQQQQQLMEDRNRRNVVFRDLTDDALRFNHSILKATTTEGSEGGTNRGVGGGDGGGLARILQQVNNLNGNGSLMQLTLLDGVEKASDEPQKRSARAQKPPAPKPPQLLSDQTTQKPDLDDQHQVDDREARMRAHVYTIAERKEKQLQMEGNSGGARIYDPSAQELPTVAEEKEEKDLESRRNSGLYKMDSSEALREEIKQEILSELLQSRTQSRETINQSINQSPPAAPQAEEKAKAVSYKKLTEGEKRRLIADIRQQLLGDTSHTLSLPAKDSGWRRGLETPEPEPDYSEDEVTSQTPGQLSRFASQTDLPVTLDATTAVGPANGHYGMPQVQIQRRYKGPAPAPPNGRYRRAFGPPVVREPYQTFSEEPIYAYEAAQVVQNQQQQEQQQLQQHQEQMEKAYDDRFYKQKSRSKRFGDSWKRMTASLSKAFGISSGGGGGAGAKAGAGVGRRSSVRDSTFQRPPEVHPRESALPNLGNSRAGSVYSLASVEMPLPLPATTAPIAVGSFLPHESVGAAGSSAAQPVDIWRDVAIASHDQMQLSTNNPVFGIYPESSLVEATPLSNGHAGGSVGISISSNVGPPSVQQAGAPVPARVHVFREQTYL